MQSCSIFDLEIFRAVRKHKIVQKDKVPGEIHHRSKYHGQKKKAVTSGFLLLAGRCTRLLFFAVARNDCGRMAHREFSSSSSSSNPLIWDRSSSAAQAHTNKIYHHRSNGNSSSSSKKGDLIRWATSIGISLVVFTLVLNNNSTFQLQPYLSDAAKRVYNFCRALVRDVAHSMLSTPPGGRDSPPSSSSSSRTTTVSTTRDHSRRRFIAAPHNNNVHSSYSSADVPPHNSQSEKDDDLRITRHQGSCHCAAVAFHVSSIFCQTCLCLLQLWSSLLEMVC